MFTEIIGISFFVLSAGSTKVLLFSNIKFQVSGESWDNFLFTLCVIDTGTHLVFKSDCTLGSGELVQ
jgi:hypothetical protein